MVLEILNEAELNAWLDERRALGRDVFSVKGQAPRGATYSDGTPITRPVNVGWCDPVTEEIFHIQYRQGGKDSTEFH